MSEVKPDLVVATVQGDDVQRYLCWHPDKPAFNYEVGAEVVLLSELERVQKISDNYYAICVDREQELAALREELAKSREAAKEELDGAKYTRRKFRQERDESQQRLTAAEQRNAAIVGKITKCKECGSSDLFWFAQNNVPNGIQQNRLNTHDVKCVFVLGCNECSETLKLVSADKIAEQMTAAIKPAESGASE